MLADDRLRHDFAGRGYDEAELARLPVLDPTTTVRSDVATLLDFPNLSARVRVSGYSYDVKTGLLTTTVAPRQRGN